MTDTFTHTPGPWFAREDGCIAVGDNSTSKTLKLRLLKVISPWVEGAWDDDPEALANARLIAAAPAMLEALKEASDWLDWYFAPEPSVRVGPSSSELKRLTRAAIALATGEGQ